jgi:predicted porin
MAPEQPAELSNKEEIHTMQKKLIAAAVAGLIAVPALAQTNVTISGNIRAGWEQYKLSGNGGHDAESRVSDQSSGLRINAVEDLGGGLKAWMQLDYRGAVDTGALANSGNSGVGFMGNWGKFTIGRWDLHYGETSGLLGTNRAGSLQSMIQSGLLSQVNGTSIANATRTPNVLMWDSPNWNGFTGRLAYSSNWSAAAANEGNSTVAAGNPGGGSAWTGAVRYQNGPWAAGYSYWAGNQEARGGGANTVDQRGHRLNLGYTFAMGLKLGIAYDRSSLERNNNLGDNRRSAWYLPVSYAFGPHAVYFQYARAGQMTNDGGTNSGANAWSLGYDYAFSKRTSAGIFYTKLNNNRGGSYDLFGIAANGATNTAAGEDARQFYIGMNHTF